MVARCVDLGRCIVLEIKPNRLAHYREFLADLDVPDERKDEVIRTLASFFQSLIDRAFGVDPVQLAVKDRLSDSFQTAASPGKLLNGHAAARVDLDHEGAITPSITRRDVRHDADITQEGSHLLPRI